MAKGKKAMFVFILEVLDGDGPKPGSFWEVPKKRRHRPTLLKKPKVLPVASEALVKAPLALTLIEQPDLDGNDLMTGVMPSALPDPPTPVPSFPNLGSLSAHPLADAVYTVFPISCKFDRMRIVRWGEFMCIHQIRFNVATLERLTVLSGHTGICATRVLEALRPIFNLG